MIKRDIDQKLDKGDQSKPPDANKAQPLKLNQAERSMLYTVWLVRTLFMLRVWLKLVQVEKLKTN